MSDTAKWSCDYCTYENYPNAIKCTMCRGPRPLMSEDIYKLSTETSPSSGVGAASGTCCKRVETSRETGGKWTCDMCTFSNQVRSRECSNCRTGRPAVAASNLHEHLKPLRISDSCENINSCSPGKQYKWSCSACTYENWPKAKKCIMCGTVISNHISPTHSNTLSKITPSPERDINSSRHHYDETNNSLKRVRKVREEGERQRGWLNACLAVVQGDLGPVQAYLASGGVATRQLTQSDLTLLNRPSAFDVGYTLVHLAIRFKREDILATLVASLDSSGSGLKRVPSYVAPELAQAIRRHAATLLTNGKLSHSLNCPYLTEFNTFYLPYDIDELPVYIQEQVFTELLDKDAQAVLEAEPPVINWSVEVTVHLGSRLYALWNRSQGDCLLDSLMQAMWGVFDRDCLLRRALADTMHHAAHVRFQPVRSSSLPEVCHCALSASISSQKEEKWIDEEFGDSEEPKERLYPRWVEFEALQAKQLDFSLSDSQWAQDWAALVSQASQPGASLQQLHIFALAHVLRRPIIVYGVKVVKSFRGEDIGYAGFEGVYLPLLWEVGFCSTSPLCLGYTRGHFSALVGVEPYPLSQPAAHNLPPSGDNLIVTFLPLVDSERKLLPIHFLTKVEMSNGERLLRQWLDVNLTEGGLLVAQQKCSQRPLLVAQMLEEWLNHYRSIARLKSAPNRVSIPSQDFSSDGESDDE